MEGVNRIEPPHGEPTDTRSQAAVGSRDLARAKSFTENIIRSMVNALLVVDATGTVTIANEAAAKLIDYGVDELVGISAGTLLYEGDAPVLFPRSALWEELLSGASVQDREMECVTKDGTRVPVEFSGSVLEGDRGTAEGVVCVLRDLREWKRLLSEVSAAAEAERAKSAELESAYRRLQELQAHLIQSEKMSSLGRMAAGVAHEINNPLGGIAMFSHLVLEETSEDDVRRPNLEKIVRETARCSEIVKGLLGFARAPMDTGWVFDPGQVLRDALGLLQGQSIFHNIRVSLDIESDLPLVAGDRGQIQQAFTNILINASDAMDGNGRLTLSVKRMKGPCAVAATFCDTGKGIREEDAARIFEPFFTTKPPGGGIGLGLAVTYGIVKQHGGSIRVESELGKGTVFEVELPCDREES